MKTNIVKHIAMSLAVVAGTSAISSCSRDFLDPDPLSMYEPGKTFSTESGLQAALAMADRHLCNNYTYYNDKNISCPIATEYMMSDLMLYGKTDQGGGIWDDVNKKLTPTSGMQENDNNYMSFYWGQGYTGVKYANTILSYIDGVKGLSEATKNEYKGRAYFHRAYRYYNLCWQWGDIPLVTKILEVPKQNYKSTKRDAILRMCVSDMEKAVEWVPSQKQMSTIGMVNKEACRMLLAKLYLSIGEWKKAEQQCDELINNSGLALMKKPFGSAEHANGGEPETWNITRNVIWDLHRPVNKYRTDNTETILAMLNVSDQRHVDYLTMRIFGPNWNDNGNLKTPDGKGAGMNYARNNSNYRKDHDLLRAFGRGIATFRPTAWSQHTMWEVNGVEDNQDLRHNSEVGNWVHMTDLKYNNKSSKYDGKPFQLYDESGKCLCNDTIRDWFDFPLYKIYFKDASAEANLGATQFNGCTKGTDGTLYLYRLAEAYLLRAEAKFYQGDATAADDVNEIRKRANCSQFYTTVNIGDIMNERARELYLEEWRNVELTRVSYDLALSGKPDEWGNIYDVNTWDKQEGTDLNGGSYWYQRCVHYSYYNRPWGMGIKSGKATLNYTMNKNNVFWPIPDAAITANRYGKLAQNYGYSGYDANVPMFTDWKEAVADEDSAN